MLIGVIKTASSNYRSICRALEFLRSPYALVEDEADMRNLSHIIIPGVSKFGTLMKDLEVLGLIEPLNSARNSGTAILGLCAGMQIMGKKSEESPGVTGLGWFEFEVTKFKNRSSGEARSFHTGWNDVEAREVSQNFETEGCFYFNHSYYVKDCNTSQILGLTDNGTTFVSVVGEGNIVGAQFHPEKSQTDGLRFISRFLELEL
jgi:glutamine amidotransferase